MEVTKASADRAVDADDPDIAPLMVEVMAHYDARRADWGEEMTGRIESYLVLTAIDQKWKDHLYAMDSLKAGIGLRGYESNYQVGDEAIKVGAAYRLPIWRPYRNLNATFPFYLQQLFMEIFYEGGRINDSAIAGADDEWLNAAGVEVNFATKLLRFLPVAPGLGVAYAFDREERGDDGDRFSEKWSLYLSIKTSVNF
jgi:hypothetical protein